MRGYTKEEVNSVNSIEKWTLEQCEEYLQNYPNGLSAEAVRQRLEEIKPDTEKHKKKKQNVSGVVDSGMQTQSSVDRYDIQVLKALATLALIVLMIYVLAQMINGEMNPKLHNIAVSFLFPIWLIGKMWNW